LQQERKNWRKDHPPGFWARPMRKPDGSSDMLAWAAGIPGKEGTDWEGGVYTVELIFPSNYPTDPPTVYFKPVIFHPNIYSNGKVCLSILDRSKQWTPSITIKQMLIGVQDLLDNPNNNDPAQGISSNLLRKDPAAYSAAIREQAKRYAPGTTATASAAQIQDEASSTPNEWDSMADAYSTAFLGPFAPLQRATASKVARLVEEGDGGSPTVVDFGTGPGEPALTLAGTLAAGARVLAVDASGELLRVARGRCGELVQVAQVERDAHGADVAERLGISPGSVNVVVSCFTLMYFTPEARVAWLCNMRSLLRTGGRVLLVTWGAEAHVEWLAGVQHLSSGLANVELSAESDEPSSPPGSFALASKTAYEHLVAECVGARLCSVQLETLPVEFNSVADLYGFIERLPVFERERDLPALFDFCVARHKLRKARGAPGILTAGEDDTTQKLSFPTSVVFAEIAFDDAK
ncbi:SUMO-conjugating enzyme ubc9 (Ubiquitin carrier protein 9) (Ubiquitin carrier protein hus5) (Ubiquitin-conjugating enzyme E2-18 kDa), partial [Durusdinium trenchii]